MFGEGQIDHYYVCNPYFSRFYCKGTHQTTLGLQVWGMGPLLGLPSNGLHYGNPKGKLGYQATNICLEKGKLIIIMIAIHTFRDSIARELTKPLWACKFGEWVHFWDFHRMVCIMAILRETLDTKLPIYVWRRAD